MNESLTHQHKLGSEIVIDVASGRKAFVPHRLPEEIELDVNTVNLLVKAAQAIGKLSAASEKFPNPDLMLMSYIAQEALSSSKIEGTVTTLSEVFAALALSVKHKAVNENDDVAEVRSCIDALRIGLEKLTKESAITHDLLCEVHRNLMANPRGEGKAPGRYRQKQNYIGAGRRLIHIPPPVQQMKAAMDDLVNFTNAANKLPDLVAVGLAHYQFETIHPFEDGNGRLGRMLIVFQMISLGLLRYPVLPLSTTLLEHRRQYYEYLQSVREEEEYSLWLQFFLYATIKAANKSLEQIENFENLRTEYHSRVQGGISKPVDVVGLLFKYPVITASHLVEELSISRTTAGRWIEILVKRKVLYLLPTRQGDGKVKLYAAARVFEILDPHDSMRELDPADEWHLP